MAEDPRVIAQRGVNPLTGSYLSKEERVALFRRARVSSSAFAGSVQKVRMVSSNIAKQGERNGSLGQYAWIALTPQMLQPLVHFKEEIGEMG